MRKSIQFLILLVLTLFIPSMAMGQSRGYGEREEKKPKAKIGSGYHSRAARYRPSIYTTRGYAGFILRSEQLRAEQSDKLQNRRNGLLESPLPSGDPVNAMLNYRNALRVRSGLADRSTALIGRQDYIIRDGVWAGAVKNLDLPIATPATLTMSKATGDRPLPKGEPNWGVRPNLDGSIPTGSYNDALIARLEKRGQDYLRMGYALYREKKYLEASEYFDLYRQTASDDPRCFALQALCAFQRRDYNSALLQVSLMLVQVDRVKATTLDDIWFNWQDLYERRQDFTRLVDEATLIAKTPGSNSRFSILMAYFQWLNGDTNTALSAMDSVIDAMERESLVDSESMSSGSTVDRAYYARKFRGLLVKPLVAPATTAPAAAGVISPSPATMPVAGQ